jgi:hypothetical protein
MLADAAMAVIDEDATEPTTKITDITINNKKLLHEIIFFIFKDILSELYKDLYCYIYTSRQRVPVG